IKHSENVLGTVDYMSPEAAVNSHNVDIRGDIYSLGATFYYCLTSSPPFPQGSMAQKLIWHQARTPKPISDFRQDVPVELTAIINKAMSKDPKDRYPTPAHLVKDIDSMSMLTGETTSSSSDHTLTKPEQWRLERAGKGLSRWLPVAAGVAFLLSILGMVMFWVAGASLATKPPAQPRIKPTVQQKSK